MTKIVRQSPKKVRPVPGATVFAKTRKSAAYQKAFDDLADEFALLSALMSAQEK